MNTLDNIKQRFEQIRAGNGNGPLSDIKQDAFKTFEALGIPTVRNEEWKYTRISSLFNKDFVIAPATEAKYTRQQLDNVRIPGFQNVNELVFVNGRFVAEASDIRSSSLIVLPLAEAAAGAYKGIVTQHLGHSTKYVKDGIHALNTAFVQDGVFISVKKGQVVEQPVFIYHLTDAQSANTFAQPRALVHINEAAQVQFVEAYVTNGNAESFTNQVIELIVEKYALVEYYKIENDTQNSTLVSTTHFRQVGKSTIHTVTISLHGNVVRNNLNIAMEAAYSDAHMYGLYFLEGSTHVDNHTIVDNVMPNCVSNEFYKGIIDQNATAVFNGKIYVQQDAQKTNAFQSNKNILLSDTAQVNTKPQLEIFADDVKCSHGCTVGQLDEEGMFYLRSRGISEKNFPVLTGARIRHRHP